MNYSAKIDPAIYSPATKGFTASDFMALCLAAADQAGLNKTDQDTIRFVFQARDIYLVPTRKLAFPLRVSRMTGDREWEFDCQVEATIQWDGAKWQIEECGGITETGDPADTTSDQKQIEEAVEERAAKESAP